MIISDERDQVLGTGGGVVKALPLLGDEPFFHVNSDTMWIDGVRSNLARLAETFDPDRMDILLLMAPTDEQHRLWRPRRLRHAAGRRACASAGNIRSCRSSMRRRDHVARPFADAPNGEFSLTKMFDRANEQERLFGLRLDGVWMHVGTPDAIARGGRGVSRKRRVRSPVWRANAVRRADKRDIF